MNNKTGIVVFDTETTGLDFETDEIIQFSAIDGYGNTLLNTYIHPLHHTSWNDAMSINGIKPEMVKDAPSAEMVASQIKDIFDSAALLVSYNGIFDIKMIEKNMNILGLREKKHYDVMQKFAEVYGEWNPIKNDYKWQKLTKCANYFNYSFDAHDSLEDVKATLYCYNQLIKPCVYEVTVSNDEKTSIYMKYNNCVGIHKVKADFAEKYPNLIQYKPVSYKRKEGKVKDKKHER